MASPQIFTFFLFDETTGAPFPGQAPAFDSYNDDTGTPVTPPTITDTGAGAYTFTPVFPVDKGLAFVINGGAGTSPRYQAGFLRPEEFYVDLILDLNDVAFGKWEIKTAGPDNNRLILYRPDGSVLKKFDLTDVSATPSPVDTYKRNPV
jgi:hypothetical protein